ncbi:hypothetical protein, partial [Secundilactobacillus kimchicus]|uniref:hypothetical protein n=1 Tax=Secundilactobacillus kimchicus TaxID=528209 RepID=UPI0024A81B92
VGMTIHVGNIDDGTVEEFLNTIDIERLLNKFGIIEATEYTEYGEETVYKDTSLHSPTLPDGNKLISLMNQQFEEVQENLKNWDHNDSYYGVAA